MNITDLSESQLAGIAHRAALDGPPDVEPVAWYITRAEWELARWAEEAGAKDTVELAKKIEALSESDKEDIKSRVDAAGTK